MQTETDTVQGLFDAFEAKDVEKIMSFFAEDAIYHNMPGPPAKGTEAIRAVINMFVRPAESIEWEVLNVAQVGSNVLTERVDRFVMGGKNLELPVMGTFEVSDGKITAWRDYFDMATWTKQMGG